VPFLIFTPFAGNLADRISKRAIMVAVKIVELGIMILGCLAFMSGYDWPVYGILFLMSTQSAFFGPSKYGIIPELIDNDQLSKGNGIVEMLSYVAIIVGTGLGLTLSKMADSEYLLVSTVPIAIAVIGIATSLLIKRTPPAGATQRASLIPLRDVYRTIADIGSDRNLVMTVFASAFFLFIGAFVQINILSYGMKTLELAQEEAGYIFLLSAFGIGLGSLLSAKISGRGIEMGLVPVGALGLTATLFVIGLMPASITGACIVLFALGLSGGLFIVPVHSYIQYKAPREKLGKVVAASNFVGWVGVLLAAVLSWVFADLLNMSPTLIFVLLGLVTLAVTILTVFLVPHLIIRAICVALTHVAYRIKACNVDNVPLKGGVLIICNHVSWADGFLLSATQQRPIRFVMDREIYSRTRLKPLLDIIRVIPISENDPPKQLVRSLRQARQAVDDGDIVCMFAEGTLTRTGLVNAFKSGFEKVLRGTEFSVIPAYIGGAWGSIFSYYRGKLFGRFTGKFPRPISIYFGEPMPSNSTTWQIRQKVLELSSTYFNDLKSGRKSLAETFVRMARGNWSKRCIADGTGDDISYGKALVKAIALSDKIQALSGGTDNIGILLPPSIGGTLTNIAVTMLGKTSVNLNYTVTHEGRMYAVDQCGIKCVISSRSFLEKAKLEQLPGTVFLEDIVAGITSNEKILAILKARFIPRKMLVKTKSRRFSPDDPATIIFSSGSTGTPKGVVLTHHNILSNVEAVRVILAMGSEDNVCAVLPLFHSFGYTCGLWLPVAVGGSVACIANPLDAKLVGESVAAHSSTIIFAPPTFLMGYMRRVEPDDFKTLRVVGAGAEKLKLRLAEAFEKRFGTSILEGYGATELSPVAALNIHDVEIDGVYQVGRKLGTVGRPLPGVAVDIVDPSTLAPLGPNTEGLIMVKGPNVMAGYLNRDDLTEKAIIDGWYDTGDIGKLDDDGFLSITDRLARFSKIGGEMVPYLAIEEVIFDALKMHEQVVAVTSIPDEKKGEQLVVLYTDDAPSAEKLCEIVDSSNMPNIFKPKRANYIKVDEMPLLGSGKLDIIKLRKIATEIKGIQ
jgi:acyl-[acyl-carrier-protein]-phospholipid O-acyltransferase/long-chain-fatty-acid--[acyl-carrier-protein] ligase